MLEPVLPTITITCVLHHHNIQYMQAKVRGYKFKDQDTCTGNCSISGRIPNLLIITVTGGHAADNRGHVVIR